MKIFALLTMAALLPISGCKAVQAVENALNNLTDAQLASYIQQASSAATYDALKLAAKKNPGSLPTIISDAQLADSIDKAVVQNLNSSVGNMVGSIVSTSLQQFSGKLGPDVSGAIQTGILAVEVAVDIPVGGNKLTPRTEGAIIAAFNGISGGAEKWLAEQAPAPPAPTPAPGVKPPTARLADTGNVIIWPTRK